MGDMNVRRATGIAAAVCLVAGPLAGLLIEAFNPASTSTESIARYVVDAAAHPDRVHAVLLVDRFVFLLVPAALAAVWLAWRRAPVLSLVAGALSLAGWISIVIMVGQDSLIAQAARSPVDHAQAIALANAWSNSGAVDFYTTLFVAGHLLGTIFLGVALWRSRAIPRWAAVCVGVSMPLHLVAFLSSIRPLDVGAWSLLLIGFTACAREVLRETAIPVAERHPRTPRAATV